MNKSCLVHTQFLTHDMYFNYCITPDMNIRVQIRMSVEMCLVYSCIARASLEIF